MRDVAYFSYLAEMGSQGSILYRDIFSLHPPLHMWLTSLASLLAGSSGLAGFGLLLVGVLTMGSIAASQLALGRRENLLGSIALSLLVWGVGTAWADINFFVPCGGRPSLLASVFLVLGLIWVAKERFLPGGALLAAACFSWQPALLIAAAAGVPVFLHLKNAERIRWPLKLLPGGVGVVVVVALFLLFSGVLDEFFSQSVLFALSNPTEGEEEQGRGLVAKMITMLPTAWFLAVGLGLACGLLSLFFPRAPRAEPVHGSQAMILRLSMAGWVVGYGTFLLFNFQGRGDLIPLLVPVGILCGWWVGSICVNVLRLVVPLLAAVLCLFILLDHEAPRTRSEFQRNRLGTIQSLARDEGALILGDPFIQRGIGGEPSHPYVYWEAGTVAWMERNRPGAARSFASDQMKERPAVVVVGSRAEELLPYLTPFLSEYRSRPDLSSGQSSVWVREAGS